MNKYQEAYKHIEKCYQSSNQGYFNEQHLKDIKELIDLHTPKEIKVGQVWECLIEVGLIGEYESEWAVKGTAVEISSITLKNVVGIIKDRGWGIVVYLSKDLLNSSCFKIVKDVE